MLTSTLATLALSSLPLSLCKRKLYNQYPTSSYLAPAGSRKNVLVIDWIYLKVPKNDSKHVCACVYMLVYMFQLWDITDYQKSILPHTVSFQGMN